MKVIYSILLPLLLHAAVLCSQWQQITTGTSAKINSIYFADVNNGYFVTETGPNSGSIYRSTNAGSNWIFIYSSAFQMKSVYFVSQQNGFVVGKEHILVTTDSGNSWTDTYKPDYEIFDIRNVTSNYILGVGFKITPQNTAILQSYTGGNTWTSQLVYNSSTSRLHSIRFTNSNTGYTCGEYGTLMRIINGGSWNFLVTGTTNHLYSLSFHNSSTGFAAGANSTLVKTTNAGTNWSIFNTGFTNIDFRSIEFLDTSVGFIAGTNGFIARTTNSGVNWIQQTTNVNTNLNSLIYINKDTLFAAGDNGVVLRTYNGGILGINDPGIGTPNSFYLYQNYPNPFNPSTRISFDIPKSSFVNVTVYDNLGREISRLIEGELKIGKYFINWDCTNYPSGIYFCKMSCNGYVQTIRMAAVK